MFFCLIVYCVLQLTCRAYLINEVLNSWIFVMFVGASLQPLWMEWGHTHRASCIKSTSGLTWGRVCACAHTCVCVHVHACSRRCFGESPRRVEGRRVFKNHLVSWFPTWDSQVIFGVLRSLHFTIERLFELRHECLFAFSLNYIKLVIILCCSKFWSTVIYIYI